MLPLIGPVNTVSAGLLTGFFAVEWYALSMISSVLATADLVVDLSASAAASAARTKYPMERRLTLTSRSGTNTWNT